MYAKYFKRIMDLICSCLAVIVLSPVFLIIALLVKINLGSPVLFKQKRVGKNERIFEHIKFRTMTNETDEYGVLLPNELRVTKFGKILRSTSLDELPQLFNVIRGEMSIIGPRPLPVQYLNLYNDEQRKRHNVKPGLSNISAVTGRNKLTWEEKFEKDVWYVNNMSFLLDCKIIFKTLIVVFKRDGVTNSKGEFRSEFKGTNMNV